MKSGQRLWSKHGEELPVSEVGSHRRGLSREVMDSHSHLQSLLWQRSKDRNRQTHQKAITIIQAGEDGLNQNGSIRGRKHQQTGYVLKAKPRERASASGVGCRRKSSTKDAPKALFFLTCHSLCPRPPDLLLEMS